MRTLRDEAERQNKEKKTLTTVLTASLFFLFVFTTQTRHRHKTGKRITIYIDCQCLFIRTQRLAHIQRCREMERVKNSGKKEKSLFSGRVAAFISFTDRLWRLRGRLNHSYSHSITFSSCCLLFRTMKCLMTLCCSYPDN